MVPFVNCVESHLRIRCLVWLVNKVFQTADFMMLQIAESVYLSSRCAVAKK